MCLYVSSTIPLLKCAHVTTVLLIRHDNWKHGMGVHHGQAESDLSQQLGCGSISVLLPLEGVAGCLGHSCVRLPSARRAAAIAYAVGPIARGLGRLPMDLLGRCRTCTAGACMIYCRCSCQEYHLDRGMSVTTCCQTPWMIAFTSALAGQPQPGKQRGLFLFCMVDMGPVPEHRQPCRRIDSVHICGQVTLYHPSSA